MTQTIADVAGNRYRAESQRIDAEARKIPATMPRTLELAHFYALCAVRAALAEHDDPVPPRNVRCGVCHELRTCDIAEHIAVGWPR